MCSASATTADTTTSDSWTKTSDGLPSIQAVSGGVVWCGVVWCGVVWCGVVWCGVVWCGEVVNHGAVEKGRVCMCSRGRWAEDLMSLRDTHSILLLIHSHFKSSPPHSRIKPFLFQINSQYGFIYASNVSFPISFVIIIS